MKIVFMNGGLGNQMFQYIFLRWLETVTGDTCIVDDSPFFGSEVPHNGYELTRIFGVQPKRLSTCFDADVWEYMVRQRAGVAGVAQQLKDAGMNFSFIYDAPNYHYQGKTESVQAGVSIPVPVGDAYYHGYWLGNRFFSQIDKQMREEFIFPPLPDKENQAMQSLIRQSNAVALHIRRGDMAALGRCAEPAYFARAIEKMEASTAHARYFLFSDDLAWCHAHWQDLGLSGLQGRLFCAPVNAGKDAYIDMQLMAGCRHFICDRSSFSLLASYLSRSQESIMISRWNMKRVNKEAIQ